MEMGFLRNWFKWSQLVLAMVVVQMFVAGMNLLSKVILSEGSFIFALMAYRHVVAAICVAPFALCFERFDSFSAYFLAVILFCCSSPNTVFSALPLLQDQGT